MPARAELQRDRGLMEFLSKGLTATALLNRDRISILTLLLTYQCPAACDHCVFESSPKKKVTVDPQIAKLFIEAASRQVPPPVLGFSGGEPFLQIKMMRELVSFAAERGMASEVVSSSSWARDPQQARAVLADLAARGLQTYCTSVDQFHTPFVSPANMRNAIAAAQDVGLHVIINTQVDPETHARGEEAVHDYLAATLELPLSELRELQINPLVTTPVGRARTNVTEFLDQKDHLSDSCPMATEVVTLSPYGLLYPCCGMVVGERPEDAGLFIQDDLANKTVDEIAEILDALKRDLFFKILQYIGPHQLLLELKRRDPTLITRERFTGSCDVCLEYTQNKKVAAAAARFLLECQEQLESVATAAE